jgi:Flp pilus assembly protein TadD
MPKPFVARLLPPGQVSLALTFAITLSAVGGCAQSELRLADLQASGPLAETASIDGEARPAAPERAQASAAAITRARALRAKGEKQRALALLEQAASSDTGNKALLAEQGLLALDLGQVQKAEALLRKAIDAKSPDWRLHSGLGAAISAQGRQAEAQVEFGKALALAPDHPSVLNNLALSYALEGKHEEAERLLRRLAQGGQHSQTRQNLALLLGLKGKIEEARKVSAAALPPEQARANVGYLQALKAGKESASLSRAEPAPAASVASAERDARAQAAAPAEAASQPN